VSGLVAAVITSVVAVMVSVVSPAPPGAGPDLGEIDRFLSGSLERLGAPGMAVSVVRGTDVIFQRGYGVDGRGQGVTAQTPFRIASLSKSFTAAAVMQLVEAGSVDLDAPVRTYLPDFVTADPDASGRITVRHLLNQTSGLSDAGFPAITGAQPATLSERLASLQDARLVAPPGREYHYFGPNYEVLAALVEVVSGESIGEYLRRRLFEPLGMTHTVHAATAQDAVRAVPGLAPGHVTVFGFPVVRDELDGFLAGSGGMVSTAADMGRWLIMQSTGAGPVSAAGIRLMHTPPEGVAGGYAQGWQVITTADGPTRIEHTGVLSTHSAVQVLLPDSGYAFTVLYAANSALADTAGVTAGLAALLSGRPPGEVRSIRLVAGVLGALALGILVLRAVQLARLPRWRRRRAARARWRAVPGILWLLLPVGLLAAVPALVGVAADRSFTVWQLWLAMPDVMIVLTVGAVSGAVLAVCRTAVLLFPPDAAERQTIAPARQGHT
jgi:CubicO group peptidase (beta-lactamase class C family)